MTFYRHDRLPDVWPGTPTRSRKASPFGANWGDTLHLLQRELRYLNARDVVLHVAASARDIRQDGGLRADARIKDPSIIVSFTAGADRLTFPCDRFNWWQDNVRAVALALESLRRVDRYGVQQGRQYQGYKALPRAATPTARTPHDVLRSHGVEVPEVMTPDAWQLTRRRARARLHPDAGGTYEAWHEAEAALHSLKPETTP